MQEGSIAGDGALPPLPGWLWPLCWVVVAVAVGLLVRLPGPATLDPDEHAVHYFDSLVAGERLEEPLLSSPKPLLTVVHGLAWRAGHDWRLEALAVAAFALAVVCLARSAGRLAGLPAAAATALAVAGSGPPGRPRQLDGVRPGRLVGRPRRPDQRPASRGQSRGAGSRAPGSEARPPGGWPSGSGGGLGWRPRRCSWPGWPGPRAGCCCRWPPATASSPGGAASGGRPAGPAPGRAAGLAGPRLAADRRPAVRARVPGRYSDLVSGRQVVPLADWLALVARRYAADPLLLALAAVGVIWLFRRRAWVWLAALGAAGVGVLALLGLQAWQGTYISWRYFDPADVALRVAAALGAAAVAGLVAGRCLVGPPREAGGGHPAGPPRAGPAVGVRPRALGAVAGAVVLVGLACWPLAPGDPLVDSTLDRDTRLSANTATAVAVLAPVTAEPGTVVTVSGPQRLRVAVELGLPLDRVRDLFLAGRLRPLDRALAGSAAVFHDADGDRPVERFAPSRPPSPPGSGGRGGPAPHRSRTGPVRPPGRGVGRASSLVRTPQRYDFEASNIALNLGSGGETRTRNKRLNRPLLCRLSYPGLTASPRSAMTSPMILRWVAEQL